MKSSSSCCAGDERHVCRSISSGTRRYLLYDSGAFFPYSFDIIDVSFVPRSSDSKSGADFLGCSMSAGLANFLHLSDDQFEFLIPGVEMRRDAHAGAGTIIDDELTPHQLFGKRRRVVVPNRDRATAAVWIFWTADPEAGLFGKLNQVLSLPDRKSTRLNS